MASYAQDDLMAGIVEMSAAPHRTRKFFPILRRLSA